MTTSLKVDFQNTNPFFASPYLGVLCDPLILPYRGAGGDPPPPYLDARCAPLILPYLGVGFDSSPQPPYPGVGYCPPPHACLLGMVRTRSQVMVAHLQPALLRNLVLVKVGRSDTQPPSR